MKVTVGLIEKNSITEEHKHMVKESRRQKLQGKTQIINKQINSGEKQSRNVVHFRRAQHNIQNYQDSRIHVKKLKGTIH